MTGLIDGNFAQALQVGGALSAKGDDKLKNLQNSLTTVKQGTSSYDDAAAREVANKFEALLVHNMLKSMRKTTMAEDTSNSRAIYDDMLDEQLADTMIKSGGLGIADQIVRQIQEQQGITAVSNSASATQVSDQQRLRELSVHLQRPASTASDANALANKQTESHQEYEVANIGSLHLATSLWGSSSATNERQKLSDKQKEFVTALTPHARRNAQRLGTSPNAIVAIAALETGWGRSMITDANGNNSHNLFGIKANTLDNRYATSLTTEYVNGTALKQHANFKTFDNDADAVDGFAEFILDNPRYTKALEHAGDSDRFLEELQHAGYATDPQYAAKAKSIMRQIAGN